MQQNMGILRSVCSQEWGGDQKTILHLYRVFIRSKLDYGSIVYQSVCNTTKQILYPTTTECIRLATGAFKLTPEEALHAISGEMNLELRRRLLTLKYYYKIKSQLSNSVFNVVTSTTHRRLYNNKRLPPPFGIRIQEIMKRSDLSMPNVRQAFSYTLFNIEIPTRYLNTATYNTELMKLLKQSTNDYVYRQHFHKMVSERYSIRKQLFTDGSKCKDQAGATVVGKRLVKNMALPSETSVFSAELCTVDFALQVSDDSDDDTDFYRFP